MNALDAQKQGAAADREEEGRPPSGGPGLTQGSSIGGESLPAEGDFEDTDTVGVPAEPDSPSASSVDEGDLQGRDDRVSGAGAALNVG